jgi:hypothetical protein
MVGANPIHNNGSRLRIVGESCNEVNKMIILGSRNTAQIEPLVAGRHGQTIKYYIASGYETVGYLELDKANNEWAIEQKPGFSMTAVFLDKIWAALISSLEEDVRALKRETS